MKSYFNEEMIKKMLKLAGFYNLLWGLFVIFFPHAVFNLLGMPQPNYIELWQCIGMIVGVYGIGYLIAANEPETHWPIVLVGFLGKIFGPIGFLKALYLGTLPFGFSSLILFNDIVWLVPFYYALMYAYEVNVVDESAPKKFNDLIKLVKSNRGNSLYQLSNEKNVLLVFVRHFGCTFCRETVSEIAKLDESIKGKNLTPVFIHMSDPSFGDEFFAKYYKHPVEHVSDPSRLLYKSLNLKRGTLLQLFGPKIWLKGLWCGFFKGRGLGPIEGDALQLGGFFILSRGQIVFEHKTKTAADFFELSVLPNA